MSRSHALANADVLDIFTEEITARGGRVTSVFEEGDGLLARSVLPRVEKVRPGDRMQAGVAVKANEDEVLVHPYLFREVCRNGAITARVLSSREVGDLDLYDRDQAFYLLREAIDACATEETFTGIMSRLREAGGTDADLALDLMSHFSRRELSFLGRALRDIKDRFFRSGDRSRYGLMNAVTSVARDTTDAEERWNLEELGGQIGAGLAPPPRPRRPSTYRAMPRELAETV